jgi:hypothetical protein
VACTCSIDRLQLFQPLFLMQAIHDTYTQMIQNATTAIMMSGTDAAAVMIILVRLEQRHPRLSSPFFLWRTVGTTPSSPQPSPCSCRAVVALRLFLSTHCLLLLQVFWISCLQILVSKFVSAFVVLSLLYAELVAKK